MAVDAAPSTDVPAPGTQPETQLETQLERRQLRVMSCEANITVLAEPDEHLHDELLDHATRRLRQLERRWSRFVPDSEISGLNSAGGAARRVSDDTVHLVERLVTAWHQTCGAFDPTLLGALVELGYSASRSDATMKTSLPPGTGPIGRPDLVEVDRQNRVVRLPVGTVLDPGGLGKGLAADLVVDELTALGAHGALVEIGGDLRVSGRAPNGSAWPIAVRSGDRLAVRIDVAHGGVATSSSRLRTWKGGERTHHHVIDPSTSGSTSGDVVGCTVIAGSAATAEAFTKVAFVRGADDAVDMYHHLGLAARIVTDDGTARTTPAWSDFAR